MNIIKKPIVTEKMTELGEKLNRYGFKVQRDANKIEIKNAIEALYNVTVVDVNTMIAAPKKRIVIRRAARSQEKHQLIKSYSYIKGGRDHRLLQ